MTAKKITSPVQKGDRFGLWTVMGPGIPQITRGVRVRALRTWICACDCGGGKTVTEKLLKKGESASCGCHKKEMTRLRHTKHGQSKGGEHSAEYRAWKAMKSRCGNKSQPSYARYGGRGIQVCARWQSSFESFLSDMGPRPSTSYSLDRIDNDKNYAPDNCRWADAQQQINNRSNTRFIHYKGVDVPLAHLAKKYGITSSTLALRIFRYKWPVEKALMTPIRVLPKHRDANTVGLKPCPFCGGGVRSAICAVRGGRWFDCSSCKAQTRISDVLRSVDAVAFWNRRVA